MKYRGPYLSNCIRADAIRDMLNVVELAYMIGCPPTAGPNFHEAQELINDVWCAVW